MVIIFRSETPSGRSQPSAAARLAWGLKPSAYVRRSIQAGTQHDEAIPNCFGKRTRRGQKPTAESRHRYFIARDNPEHRRRRALLQLERLGYRVTLEPVVT